MKSACIYNDRFNTCCIFHSQLLLVCAFNALTVKTGLGAEAIARTHLKEQLGSQLAEIYIMFLFLLRWYAAIRGHSWLSTAGVHSALRPTPSCLAFGFSVSRFLLESRYWGTKSLYSRYDLLFTFCVANVCLSQISRTLRSGLWVVLTQMEFRFARCSGPDTKRPVYSWPETGSNLHLGAKSLSQGDLLCRSKMLFLCRTNTCCFYI